MVNTDNLHVYLATGNQADASHIEDQLVLDGFDVSTFPSAKALWEAFHQKPTRFVISDRKTWGMPRCRTC